MTFMDSTPQVKCTDHPDLVSKSQDKCEYENKILSKSRGESGPWHLTVSETASRQLLRYRKYQSDFHDETLGREFPSRNRTRRSCTKFGTIPMALVVGLLCISMKPVVDAAPRRPPQLVTRVPVLQIRGGSSNTPPPSSSSPLPPSKSDYPAAADDYPPQQWSYDPPSSTTTYGMMDEDPMHETVQSRVDNWKEQQALHASEFQQSPRDDQGRVKLLTSVSKGGRAIIFFVLLWRNLYLYEVADQTHKGLARILLVTPLIAIFFGNLMGIVSSLATPSHAAKRRLKAVLNLDKLVEASLIVYSFGRLTIFPSKYVPREIFLANIFHSLFIIIQCQVYTRFSWDDHSAQPLSTFAHGSAGPAYGEENAGYHPGAQTLGEDEQDRFPYDNPFQTQY